MSSILSIVGRIKTVTTFILVPVAPLWKRCEDLLRAVSGTSHVKRHFVFAIERQPATGSNRNLCRNPFVLTTLSAIGETSDWVIGGVTLETGIVEIIKRVVSRAPRWEGPC